MSWADVLGHDDVLDRFRRSVSLERLASTFLFVGAPGVGKRTFAVQLGKTLLCEGTKVDPFDSCDRCPSCQQVAAGSHPDLEIVAKPADKSFIPLELLIGDDQHRNREGLCHNISLKPFRGGRKIAIIDDADYLNAEGANCLLKTLEEPPPQSVLMLISSSEQRQLPTIRSRCQVIRFKRLEQTEIRQLLLAHEIAESESEAIELAELGNGSLEEAREFSDPNVREFRRRWLEFLAAKAVHPFVFSKEFSAFVDAAGKEAPPRRMRMRILSRIATDFYRCLMMWIEGTPTQADQTLRRTVEAASRSWSGETDLAAACLDRCIDAGAQIDANANQATLIECWLGDLNQLSSMLV